MRMVLGEVYVRSVMQFGAPVWAVSGVMSSVLKEDGYLKPMLVLHRTMLRVLLNVDK